MKTCSKCKKNKDLADFRLSNQTKDGRSSWCIVCSKAYVKEKGYSKYARRKDYTILYQREHRKDPKAKLYDRNYRNKYHRTVKGLASKLYSAAKKRSTVSGIEFTLTVGWVEEHLNPMVCEATGLGLSLETIEGQMHTYNRPSIDRKDNNKGYTPDNCQVVSIIYNKAKSDGSHEDVMAMCKALMEKLK